MLDSIDKFNELSNKELRALLLEHGLADVPVTNSSRSILIKRLNAKLTSSMDKPKTSEKTKSRETIAVVKSNAEEKFDNGPIIGTGRTRTTRSSSARRTIATPVEFDSNNMETNAEDDNEQIMQTKRRSGRNTPNNAEIIKTKASKRKTNIIIINEESEPEENDIVPLEQRPISLHSRDSRSPSLTKSEVMTTSYQHLIGDLVGDKTDGYNNHYIETRARPNSAAATITTAIPNASFGLRSGSFGIERNIPISTNLKPLNMPKVKLTTTPVTQTVYEHRDYIDSPVPQGNLSSVNRRYTTYNSDSPRMESFRQRPSMGIYPTIPESIGDGVHISTSNIQTPYLSDFARRLARLREEPLTSPSHMQTRHNTNNLLNPNHGQFSIKESVNQLWFAFDRTYNIKKYLFPIVILFVLIFVFVMIFI